MLLSGSATRTPRISLGMGSESHLFITGENIPIIAQGEAEGGSVGTQLS